MSHHQSLQRLCLAATAFVCIGGLALTLGQPASAVTGTPQTQFASSDVAAPLTGTYRVEHATITISGTVYSVDPAKSTLLISNDFDGGQTSNLDAAATFKGINIPIAVVHSTAAQFEDGHEESVPSSLDFGSEPQPRGLGLGSILLKRSNDQLIYRATVPLEGGTFATVTATATAPVPTPITG